MLNLKIQALDQKEVVTSTKLKIVHRGTTLVKNMTKPTNKVVQEKQDPNNTTNQKRTQTHKIIS